MLLFKDRAGGPSQSYSLVSIYLRICKYLHLLDFAGNTYNFVSIFGFVSKYLRMVSGRRSRPQFKISFIRSSNSRLDGRRSRPKTALRRVDFFLRLRRWVNQPRQQLICGRDLSSFGRRGAFKSHNVIFCSIVSASGLA